MSIKIYIKKTHVSHSQRKDQNISNNSKHNISVVEMGPESPSSSSSSSSLRSNLYTQQLVQYDRRKSQPIAYLPQTRRLSQQLPQRRQSQPSIRRVSLNNPYLQTGSIITQNPNLSQNSVKLYKSNNSHICTTQNSIVSYIVSRKSSVTQPSIEKYSLIDELPANKQHNSKFSIPESQHNINIENNNQTISNNSSPQPDISGKWKLYNIEKYKKKNKIK